MRIIVIGGGISGIAAAWNMRKAGHQVTLLEARPRLGGRLGSYHRPHLPTPFDNGPHLFLSNYSAVLALLREMNIGAEFEFPFPGVIPFAFSGRRRYALKEFPLPAPLNFAAAVLTASFLSRSARRRTLSAARALLCGPVNAAQSVTDWLNSRSEEEERRRFWKPLIRAALNDSGDACSVRYLQAVFRRGFCRGLFGGRLGYLRRPLGNVFHGDVLRALGEAGIEIRLGCKAVSAEIAGERIGAVITKDEGSFSCDKVTAALPPWALRRWLENVEGGESVIERLQLDRWKASPMRTLYLWGINRPTLPAFTCTPEEHFDWVFDYARIWGNDRAPLGLLFGGDEGEDNRGKREDMRNILARLTEIFPTLQYTRWTAAQEVEEVRAIPLKPPQLWGKPLPRTTVLSNLQLSGDWLHPDLPPTIEAGAGVGKIK